MDLNSVLQEKAHMGTVYVVDMKGQSVVQNAKMIAMVDAVG
jgi:hypothetical protein